MPATMSTLRALRGAGAYIWLVPAPLFGLWLLARQFTTLSPAASGGRYSGIYYYLHRISSHVKDRSTGSPVQRCVRGPREGLSDNRTPPWPGRIHGSEPIAYLACLACLGVRYCCVTSPFSPGVSGAGDETKPFATRTLACWLLPQDEERVCAAAPASGRDGVGWL